MDDESTNYSKFLEYLYNTKKIKKNSNFLIMACSDNNFLKKLNGWEDIIFEIKENFIKNVSTTNYEFTSFLITAIQKEDDESIEDLILFYNNTLHDLKIKKINKEYKIKNDYYLEYRYGLFCYISPHKPDDWYVS